MDAVVIDPVFSRQAVCAGRCLLCQCEFGQKNNGDGTVDLVKLQNGDMLHSSCFLLVYSDDPSDYEWMSSDEDEGIEDPPAPRVSI